MISRDELLKLRARRGPGSVKKKLRKGRNKDGRLRKNAK